MARDLFGQRFFVRPAEIAALWQQFEHEFARSCAAVKALTQSDATQGIPVYTLRGGRLDASFPWQTLPNGPGQDRMYAKRPHRFAFAPRSAMACRFDPAAATRLSGMLESWMQLAARAQDPLCHDSNLGVIQRILALSWCWAFLASREPIDSEDGLALEWRVLQIIEADIRFLEPQLGHSAPNNHLLADWFAGWYLRTVFPELLDNPATGDESLWCDELLSQTYPDGGSFEHSAHYHEFACEMAAAYLLLCRANGLQANDRVVARTRALLEFQLALSGTESVPIPIGNAIEDTLFPLDTAESWCPGSLREIYRALFDPTVTATVLHDRSKMRAYWLLGGKLAPVDAAAASQKPSPLHFETAGLHVLDDPLLDARLLFRTGPTQHSSVAAGHMHADLLGIYMSLKGNPLLVDSGTYTYRRHSGKWGADSPDWRGYFAGPNAHNTLSIAGHDPLGALGGDFRQRELSMRVHTTHQSGPGIEFVRASMEGHGPYSGTTRCCVHVHGEYWLIIDSPAAATVTPEEAWYGLQFSPAAQLTTTGSRTQAYLDKTGVRLSIVASSSLEDPHTLRGSTEPVGGWVSPRYGELHPAPQLRFALRPDRPASAFMFTTRDGYSAAELSCEPIAASGALLVRIVMGDSEDLLLLNPPQAPAVTTSGIDFDGRLAWIRQTAGRASMFRGVNITRFWWSTSGVFLESAEKGGTSIRIDGDAHLGDHSSLARLDWPQEG